MATSSITKNFVISGKRQVEMFADAIEASANDRPNRVPVAARQLKGKDDLMSVLRESLICTHKFIREDKEWE